MKRAIGLGGLVALAACATADTGGVAGSEWRVTAINGQATPPPPASYRLQFEQRRLAGQFGCNHFGGDYRLVGGVLTTGAMMMTEMACREPAARFEAWGMAVLQHPTRVSWQGDDRLLLSNAAGSIELVRR